MKKNIVLLIIFLLILSNEATALVSPVRRNKFNKPLLTNCEEVKLISQKTDLYHHPLGIWIVKSRSILQNLYAKEISMEVGFISGFDVELIESEMISNEFKNFDVKINGHQIEEISRKECCPNFQDRIGMTWTSDDGTASGFLDTWSLNFKPEEKVTIDISFSFVVKKPPVNFNADNNEQWYNELMTWMRMEHAKREENEFVLPLNMGSFWALSVDTLIVRTYVSNEWLTIESEDEIANSSIDIYEQYYTEPIDLFSPKPVELHLIKREDMEEMSDLELIVLRHSFYAKYGRVFDTEWLDLYFAEQPWYYKNPDYHNWFLSDFDIENLRKVYNYEQERKSHE